MEEEEQGGGNFPRELCCGGVQTRAVYACVRVCVLEVQAEVCRHVCTGHECMCGMCAPVPLCLQGDKYSRRRWNQGEESAEISTS